MQKKWKCVSFATINLASQYLTSKIDNCKSGSKKHLNIVKLWTDVYPSRIAPILMILYSFWSSWRDLSFETHFDFFGFFLFVVVVVVVVDESIHNSKLFWKKFKFQLARAGARPCRSVRPCRPPQPWPIEIWNFKKNSEKKRTITKTKLDFR